MFFSGHGFDPDPDYRDRPDIICRKLMGAAMVMAHDTVEPVPFFSGIAQDGCPAVPDHAPVPHPPRARAVALNRLVADIHFNAAAGIPL
jgi:hypothetical protein